MKLREKTDLNKCVIITVTTTTTITTITIIIIIIIIAESMHAYELIQAIREGERQRLSSSHMLP